MPEQHRDPQAADPQFEQAVNAQGGCRRDGMMRGRSRLPRHIPPMNVPSNTPSETADEPITSCRQLKPDDFVDQRRATAADKQDQQKRQERTRRG